MELMRTRILSLVLVLSAGAAVLAANDWPEWRGPEPRRVVDRDQPARAAGRRPARTSPGRCRSAAARRPSSSAIGCTCRRPPPATSRTTQERLVAVDVDSGKVVWEKRVSHLPVRRPAGPRRLGVAGGRSGDRQHLHVHVSAPSSSRSRRMARCSGSVRCRKNTAPSRRTAAARRRPSSRATRSF